MSRKDQEFWTDIFQSLSSSVHSYTSSSVEKLQFNKISLDVLLSKLYQITPVYHDKCTKRCESDPNCLRSVLNEKKILNSLKSKDATTIQPAKEGPRGLKNFGATCYLNTLIQMVCPDNGSGLTICQSGMEYTRIPATDSSGSFRKCLRDSSFPTNQWSIQKSLWSIWDSIRTCSKIHKSFQSCSWLE
jgi:ubiquitin C-terminal hydrolase